MLFSLEAVQALHGDSLLVHFGTAASPELIVVDGGPGSVYLEHLKPRLLELKQARVTDPKRPLPIRLMMISHIDDDHINGILALLRDLDELRGHAPLPFQIADFWFNSFDDLVGKEATTLAVPAAGARHNGNVETAAVGAAMNFGDEVSLTTRLVLASVVQGREVRNLLKKLAIPANRAFGGKLATTESIPHPPLSHLAISVVGPSKKRKEDLNRKWDKELVRTGLAKTASYVDNSVENLSSLVVLVESGSHSMLLTGDARGDDVLAGLRELGRLEGSTPLALDVLKIPHHGSIRDLDEDFFQLLPATHYVVSANGKYDNPDLEAMKMLTRIRQDDGFTIHLTNHTEWLDTFFAAERKKKRKYSVSYPEDHGGRTIVNLGEKLSVS